MKVSSTTFTRSDSSPAPGPSAGSGSAKSNSAGSDSAASLAAISELREKDISETNGLAEVTEQIQEEVQKDDFSKKKTVHIAKMCVRAGVCDTNANS
mgnify:CR=1 FL=1